MRHEQDDNAEPVAGESHRLITGPLPAPAQRTQRAHASRFRQNIVRIASGMVAGQAIVIGATPLLTRLYQPEDFGALAVFTAMHAIVTVSFTLKYDLSIILPKDQDTAVRLTALTLSVSLLFSSLLLIALLIGYCGFGAPKDMHYLLLPLSAVLAAAYTCAQQWGARASDYRQVANSQVLNAICNVSTSLVLAVVAVGFLGGLVVGFVAGLAGSLIYLWHGHRTSRCARPGPTITFAELIKEAREYRRFPIYVLPSSFLAILGQSAQPFLLQAMFSMREVGLYAVASRFLLMPGALVGGAVSEAFRPEFVDRLQRGLPVTPFLHNTLCKLGLFAIPVFGIFYLVAPSLFGIVFGKTYFESGVLARYLCLGVFAQFMSQPFGYVFVATGHVRLGLLTQIAMTVLPLLGLTLGGITNNLEHALLWSALLTVASCVGMVGLAYRCCRQSDQLAAGRTGHV
jgi:O-antigen/teichoic acid export membrane protein